MSRSRRLLAVTSTGQVSGAERVLVRVLAQAREDGWEVSCAAPEGELHRELEALDVDRVTLPELGLADGPKALAILRTLWAWVRAARAVRRHATDADVVLVNALTALPVIRLARPKAPAVWLAHDVVVRTDRLRLFRWCSPALTLVVGVSEAVAQRLRGGAVPVEVVHNGVTWPVEPRGEHRASGEIVVGLNGIMTPWKGHHVLLDALPLLDSTVRVELMGGRLAKDGEYADGVRARAQEQGSDRVEVLGHVASPLDRMRTWDIAVSASTDPEACPLSVLEAMSLGLSVVASDHGGSPEVLAGHGLLSAPGDPAALAAAVNLLVRDPDLRRTCGAGGRAQVESHHQHTVQTGVLLGVLERTAGGVKEASR